MKIMTFNTQHCLNYLEQKIDFPLMAQTIIRCGADIVGLNEMRSKGIRDDYDRQVDILSELTGLDHFFFAKAIDFPNKGPYGNGLLSRYPIVSAESIPIPDPEPRKYDGYYETRCVLKARLEGGITVLACHFGLNPDEQESAVATICDHLEDTKCILMGDFNVLPADPVLAPIRKRMKDTADAFREPLFSFPSDAPDRKIDYIFVSPDITVEAADIPAIVASDHRPHTATIIIPGI